MWDLGVSHAVQVCGALVLIKAGFIQAHGRVVTVAGKATAVG
jgi:hypothetical protein